MKRGDEIEVDIIDLDPKGDGRGIVDERDIIVRRAVPGDKIKGRVIKKRRGRADVEITDYIDYACYVKRLSVFILVYVVDVAGRIYLMRTNCC